MISKIREAAFDPKQTVRRLGLRAGRIVGSRQYRKFIVLARSRTGSNLLTSMLNSLWSIAAHGEILSWTRGRTLEDVLADAFCRYPHYVKAVGFKIFYYHPQ